MLESCALAAVVVGILVGSVGIGGILLPPLLTLFTGMAIHESMATSLFTFIITGVAGTILFQRRGSIDWMRVKPICAGAAIAGFFGAWLNSKLNAPSLAFILAIMIIFAGVYTLRAGDQTARQGEVSLQQRWLLLAIGIASGFASGLTGVGGPALAVPLMVLSGYSALTAIGVSQVVQIVGALSGTAGNLRYGTIDFGMAGFLLIFEIGGVVIGSYIAHVMDPRTLKKSVGILCIAVGLLFLFRNHF